MSFKELKQRSAATLAAVPPAQIPPADYVGGAAPTRALREEGVNRIRQAEDRAAQLQAELDSRPPLELALELLDSVPGRRRTLAADEFAELRENLRHNPLVHPVVVRPKIDGRFEIVSGENRVAAYRDLGRATIRVSVLELQDVEVERAAFFANLIAHDLPDFERWQGFKREQESSGMSQAELARLAGVPEQMVSDLFSFGKLPAAALEEIRTQPQRVGVFMVKELVRLSGGKRDAKVCEAVRLVVRGEIKQQQAIGLVRAAVAPPRDKKPAAAVRRIMAGRFKFVERRTSGCSMRLEFAEGQDIEKAQSRIDELLQQLADEALAESSGRSS